MKDHNSYTGHNYVDGSEVLIGDDVIIDKHDSIHRPSGFKITDKVSTTDEYRSFIKKLNITTGHIYKRYHTGTIADIHTIAGEEVATIELADGNLTDVACKYLKLRECTCGECDFCRKQMSKNETMALNEQYMTKDENENRRIVGVVY
jgi:hypothetical protein